MSAGATTTIDDVHAHAHENETTFAFASRDSVVAILGADVDVNVDVVVSDVVASIMSNVVAAAAENEERSITGAVVDAIADTDKATLAIPKLRGFDSRLIELFVNLISKEVDFDKLQINPVTVVSTVKAAMELVEGRAALSGEDKKRLVLHVTRYLVDRATFDDPRRKQLCLELFDSGVVSATIDLAVAATKGRVEINAGKTAIVAKTGCACVVS
jgi:hypothetical protein